MPEPIALTSSAVPTSSAGLGSQPASVQHAELALFETKAAGQGGGRTGAPLGTIPFQFNPKELSITKTAEWGAENSRHSQHAPPPQFKSAKPAKITVEMFFDATDTQNDSVVRNVEKLLNCCVPTPGSSAHPSPPLVVLRWGQTNTVPCYITSVSAKYTLFTSGGTPIRATASVSLEEMPQQMGAQNPTSGTRDLHGTHSVVDGDSLPSVAFQEYGRPNDWRRIAEANDIDDPLRLAPGETLLVPKQEDA